MLDNCLAIVTPTYNRADLLTRLYDSLKKQTNKNFVWYIVDDGSVDKTSEVVENLKRENQVKIVYTKKTNGGKHTAINVALNLIEEAFLVIVDSDDFLKENAVEIILNDLNRISDNEFCGIGYLKEDTNGKITGRKYTQDQKIDTFVNERYNNNTYGDKCEVFKTEILKKFPFPEIEGENFVSESTVWCKMSGEYKILFLNKAIYICEYQDGGLSDGVHKRLFKNPKGAALCYKELSKKGFKFKIRVKYTIAYIVYSLAAGYTFKEIKQNHLENRILINLLYLPAKLYYKKLAKKYAGV